MKIDRKDIEWTIQRLSCWQTVFVLEDLAAWQRYGRYIIILSKYLNKDLELDYVYEDIGEIVLEDPVRKILKCFGPTSDDYMDGKLREVPKWEN